MDLLEIGMDAEGRTQPPLVRRHTLDLGYNINIYGPLSTWLALYGGLGIFFPIRTYPNQHFVIPRNEAYSSSLNMGAMFTIARRIAIEIGGTYYLAYIYDSEWTTAEQDAFKNIYNGYVRVGWRW
jgi:hypothetical protein